MAGKHIEESSQKIMGATGALSVGRATEEAPSGWVWTHLTDVARLESGHTPSRSHPEYWAGTIPWVSIPDARRNHGGVITITEESVTQAGIDNSAARVLPAGTVCLSRTASVGYTVVLGSPMATSQDFVNWICGEALVPRFLQLLLRAEGESLLRFGKGSTHTTIYFPEVLALHICLPPVNEQHRIVARLDDLLAQILRAGASLDSIPPLLEQFRQSVLAAAFRGDLTRDWREQNPDVEPASMLRERIRTERRRSWEVATSGRRSNKDGAPPKYDDSPQLELATLPELPEGWTWSTIRDVTRAERATCYGVVQPGDESEGGVPLVRVCDIDEDSISTEALRRISPEIDAEYARSRLEGGEVLVTVVGSIGRVAVVPAVLRGANIARAVARLSLLPDVPPEWVALWLSAPFMQDFLTREAREVARKTLNIGTLELAPIPLAAPEEMRLASSVAGRALTAIRTTGETVAQAEGDLASLERAVLAKAFRGELVRQDPNDEPASVLLERIKAERNAATAASASSARRTPKSKVA